ncbi:hypothetical protein [Clostridium pasteurianum]|uniref:hypothetical protein n=1 Tax=Clostridium pasteurianum TaxID=1501 RepID=UPI0003A49107|nr:hypothetical protein [Clostridium pasteurianum]
MEVITDTKTNFKDLVLHMKEENPIMGNGKRVVDYGDTRISGLAVNNVFDDTNRSDS